MHQEHIKKIKDLFNCPTEFCSNILITLIKEAGTTLGLQQTTQLYDQWKILSEKLNNKSKLACLADKNHRLLLIKFIQYEATNQYKSSYFNRAKINEEYLKAFDLIGPYNFSEVITIVNKLKLIKKYYVDQPIEMECQENLKYKIKEILNSCISTKRTDNSNYHKFMKIVGFQDRQSLINQLSKMLRLAWSKQKSKTKNIQNKQNNSKMKIQPIINQILVIQAIPKNQQNIDCNFDEYFTLYSNNEVNLQLEEISYF